MSDLETQTEGSLSSFPEFTPTWFSSKLTPAMLQKFAQVTRMGADLELAAKLCRVHPRTVKDWMRQGRRDEEAHERGAIVDVTNFMIFKVIVEQNEADWRYDMVISAYATAQKDGKLALELLSRRDAPIWGRKDRGIVNVNIDAGSELRNMMADFSTQEIIDASFVDPPQNLLPPAPSDEFGGDTLSGTDPPSDLGDYPGAQAAGAGASSVELETALAGTGGLVPLPAPDQDGDLWEALGQE